MHYDCARNDHGLPHDPFKALVAPRPIGWISTIGADGVLNLAPYSFFNAISDRPPMVMFSSGTRKDSVRNAEETGAFTCSLATFDLREAMNASSATVPPEIDEFALAGLEPEPSLLVAPPRVKGCPAALECRWWRTVALPGVSEDAPGHHLVIGKVVAVHIDDAFVKDGRVDTAAMRLIARMGYMDYAVVTPKARFSLERPKAGTGARDT